MTTITDRHELAEAIREAIERSSSQYGGSHHVGMPATEEELRAAVDAVWPYAYTYAPADIDIGYGLVHAWLVYGSTSDTPPYDWAWRVMVQRAYAREVLAAHARRFVD